MIDAYGNLVYRPECEHDDVDHKVEASSGAFRSSQLNIKDDDELNRYMRDQFTTLCQSVKKGRKWLDENVKGRATVVKERVANDAQKTCADLYDAIATPAKKHYLQIRTVPGLVNERLEKEQRMLKAELELVQLKLAEARLQEAKLRGKVYGFSCGVAILWVSQVVDCDEQEANHHEGRPLFRRPSVCGLAF